MRCHHTRLALSLIAALSACTAVQDESPDPKPAPENEPGARAEVAGPMVDFARMVGGEWWVTFTSGERACHAWAWGPGKHSMRKMTDGSDAVGNSWAGEVMYWHPGRKQVCLLSAHGDIPAVGRGVGEGTIKFDGETAHAVIDLYQPPGRRKLGVHQTFEGSDKYHETLLEDGGAGLQPLAEWDFVRVKERSEARPRTAEQAPLTVSKHLQCFEALLGSTWEAKHDSATGSSFHMQSTYEWIPSLEVVCARAIALSKDGERTHLLDAYFYEHVGTGALRCLALSNRGGVYEGDVSALDGGALELDLKGYEDDRVVPHVVRFDFENNGTLRNRVWSLEGTERNLRLDVHHKKLEPKKK